MGNMCLGPRNMGRSSPHKYQRKDFHMGRQDAGDDPDDSDVEEKQVSQTPRQVESCPQKHFLWLV